MIATLAASSDPAIVLDVASSNWAAYKKQSFRLFRTKFGRIGASIISGIRPATFVLPSRHDVDITGSYKFNHLPRTEPPTEPTTTTEPQTLPIVIPDLTSFGYDMLRDSIKRALDQQKIDEKDDYDLLTHIFSTMSSESDLSLETHPSYLVFRATPSTQKSFECWAILTLIHSTGNASTKLLRTRNLLQSQQGDSTLSLFLQTLSTNIEQFKSDFGSPANSELVSVNEIHCFLMLTGIPRNGLFNLPINNLLAATPSARFSDPAALATTLLNWEKSSALLHLSDSPSTQASAFIATTPPLPKSPPNPPLTTFCVHCHKKYPKKPKTNTHTSMSCGLNPANRPANPPSNFSTMQALLAQAEAATPGSPTSTNLLMQLTDSAFEESLKTSA